MISLNQFIWFPFMFRWGEGEGGGGRDQAEFNRVPSSNQLKLMSLTVDPATITAGPFFVLFLPFTHTKKGKMFPNFFLKQVKTQHKKMGGQFPPHFPSFLDFFCLGFGAVFLGAREASSDWASVTPPPSPCCHPAPPLPSFHPPVASSLLRFFPPAPRLPIPPPAERNTQREMGQVGVDFPFFLSLLSLFFLSSFPLLSLLFLSSFVCVVAVWRFSGIMGDARPVLNSFQGDSFRAEGAEEEEEVSFFYRLPPSPPTPPLGLVDQSEKLLCLGFFFSLDFFFVCFCLRFLSRCSRWAMLGVGRVGGRSFVWGFFQGCFQHRPGCKG